MLKVKSIRLDSGRLEGDARFRLTDNEHPSFDWALISDQNGARQDGYQVRVRAGERILWDSGWQAGAAQRAVYQGEPLIEGEKMTVSVRARDAQDAESPTGSARIRMKRSARCILSGTLKLKNRCEPRFCTLAGWGIISCIWTESA